MTTLAQFGITLPAPGTPVRPAAEVTYHRPGQTLSASPTPALGRAMTREQLFLSELALIDRVTAWVCARHCLRGADAEDFASTVKLRFIENDYDILGRFEGRSSLKTYLTAVVTRLYLDYQTQRFGKWRPSAEARRLGPVALRLETLLYRDGLTFEEACGVLQTDFRVAENREALYDISRNLPFRPRRRAGASDDEPERADGTGDGLSTVEQAERQALADRTFLALRQALSRLPARDRIVLRLHVEGGLSVADVARALHEDQKALYRRRDAAFKQLRLDLEAEGIRCRDAHELLTTLDWSSALTAEAATAGAAPRGEP